MSFQLIPFEQNTLPTTILTALQDEFSTGQRHGFPVISIAGKVFSVLRSGVKEMVKVPGSNSPASALELVVIRANPGLSKTYYATKFVQGSIEKPDCYSNDGIAPAHDAVNPQSKSCQTCTHAQWGSRITEKGKKAKACSDVKRLAVSPLGSPEDVMMLRIPATSLRAWDDYCAKLKGRGLNPTLVATKMSFDYTVDYPALNFEPMGVLPAEAVALVAELRESDTTLSIIDASMMEVADNEAGALDNDIPFGNPKESKPAVVTRRGAAPRPQQVATLEEVVAKVAEVPAVPLVMEAEVQNDDNIVAALAGLEDIDFNNFDD